MALEDEFRFGIPRDAAPKKKQIEWGLFPEAKKRQLRKTHRDTDRDGVPDLWDCQPRNPFKQDRYTPEELDEIAGLGPLKLGNYIGAGGFGAVHDIEVKDPAKKAIADKYVVKISNDASEFHINNITNGTPEHFSEGSRTFERFVEQDGFEDLQTNDPRSIVDEYREYKDLRLDDMDIMLPAKPTMVELEGGKRAFALLKPKVDVQTGRVGEVYDTVSDEHKLQVHKGLNQLSENDIVVWDFIQGGVAQRSTGEKFQIFDTGAVTTPWMYAEKWGEDITDDRELLDPDTGDIDALKYNDQVYSSWLDSLDYQGHASDVPAHLKPNLGTPRPVPMPYSSKSKPTLTPDARHRDVDFGDSWELTENYHDTNGRHNITIEYYEYDEFRIQLYGHGVENTKYAVTVDNLSSGDSAQKSFPTYKQALFVMMRVAHLIEGEEGQLEWDRIDALLHDTMAPVRIPTVQKAFAKYNWGKWQRESVKKDDVQLKLVGRRERMEGDSTYVESMPVIQLSGYMYTEGDYRLNIQFTTRNWKDLSNRPALRNVDMWDEYYRSPEALAKAAHDAAMKIQRIIDRPEVGNWAVDRIAEFMEHHEAEGMEMAIRKRRELGRTNKPARTHAGHTGSLLGNFINAQKKNQSRMPAIR